jgi:homoserine O-acetyltransferase/O-succinyltransferase
VLTDFEFRLTEDLAPFGDTGRASVAGAEDAPVVVMIGGISGNRFPCLNPEGRPGWWSGLAGQGKCIDPSRWRVLGIDFIADATGARAPTPGDQARLIALALDALGTEAVHAVIGASFGGMIGLAFAEAFPERIRKLVVISADAAPHPASTACRELQRRVVRLGLDEGRGEEALAIARGMAMLTYRTPQEFRERFAGGIDGTDPLTCSAPGAYLRARGADYPAVMSPERFLSLSASIDRHTCRPERIGTPAFLIGATSDQLVPPEQMQDLADQLAGPSELHLLPCLYGHDMFLKEAGRVGAIVADWL